MKTVVTKQASLLQAVLTLSLILLSLLLFLFPGYVAGQTLGSDAWADTAQQQCITGLPKVPKLQWVEYEAPSVVKTAAYVITGTSMWFATYEYVDEPLRTFSQRYSNSVATDVADVLEPMGRQKYLERFAGAVIIGGLVISDKKLTQAGLVSMGGLLLNAFVTGNLKRAFQRHRPEVTAENDLFDGPWKNTGHTSLPSAHTSMAFTVATTFASVYRDSKYLPPIAYSLASLVGLSRIQHNKHWATDVLAGAAVGYICAKSVDYGYNFIDKKLKERKHTLLILPSVSPESTAVNLFLTF